MLKLLTRVSLLLIFVTSLTAAFAQGDDEARDVRFFLTFVPNVQFSPLYVAIANGHMAAQGINVVIEHGDENIGVDLIAAGEIPFGMISGEQIILARAGGRPVLSVYTWFQEYPVGIVIPDTSTGIESVSDLVGRKVGIPGRFGANYSGLTALLSANGLTEFDLELELIGFAAPDIVCAGLVEASVIYVNNEPLQIQQRADAGQCGDITSVSVIRVGDVVDMVSNAVTTSEALMRDEPDLVRAMVAAFDAGLRDAINNPALAYLISLDYVENLPIDDELRAALEALAAEQDAFLSETPDADALTESHAQMLMALQAQFAPELLTQFMVLLETLPLWQAEQLGYSDADAWANTQEVLNTLEMLPRMIDLDAAYTNDFLPDGE